MRAIPFRCVRTRTHVLPLPVPDLSPPCPRSIARGGCRRSGHPARHHVGRVGPQLPDHQTSADRMAAIVVARPERHCRRRGTGAGCARAAATIERAAADMVAAAAGFDADDRRLGRVHGAGAVVAQRQRGRGARDLDPGVGGVAGVANSGRAAVAVARRRVDGRRSPVLPC